MGLGKTYSTKYLLDSNNSSGVAGQVLSTTSTGIDWVDANTVPGAGLWLENGNDIYNSNSGNVGIGTTSPDAQLSIYKTAFGGDTAGSGGTLDFGVGSTKYWQFRLDSSSSGDLAIDKTYANVWTTPVTIQRSSGNVGIGTTSPGSKLEINENSTGTVYSKVFNQNAGVSATARMAVVAQSAQLDIIATSAGYTGVSGWADSGVISTDSGASGGLILNAQTGGLKLQTAASTKMVVLASGNVGIGTTSPGRKLQVEGGDFYTNDKSDTVGASVGYGGNSFQIRNGSTSEDLNFDIFNRTTSAWGTPFVIKNCRQRWYRNNNSFS